MRDDAAVGPPEGTAGDRGAWTGAAGAAPRGQLMGDVPLWFGPPTRPLFGLLSVPPGGSARGGVVLCPPLGDEDRMTYRTYRCLATQLADAGFVALRFSYDGTGDSAGSLHDPGRVPAWTASIEAAVELVRSTGVGRVAAVGMRLGATLAAAAARGGDLGLDGLVLWDPCVSGHQFLRQQQTLLSVVLDHRPLSTGGGVETPGVWFPKDVADEVRDLTFATASGTASGTASETAGTALAGEVLVLSRADRAVSPGIVESLEHQPATWVPAEGQAELLDVPPLSSAVPWSALDRIRTWLSDLMPDARRTTAVPEPSGCASLTTPSGVDIQERAVRLTHLGLFGIVTEPAGGGHGPWMVFLNVATEHHIGPGRQWVELSRSWAEHGLRSLRFDLSGVGDSPVRDGQAENVIYAPEWLDDVPAVAASISPADPSDVFMVGLCSGAYSALEGGLTIGARGVGLLNPAVSSVSMNKESGLADRRRRAYRTLPMPLVRLAVKHGRTAWWIWRTYRQFAVWQAPMSVPAMGVSAGLDVYVISSEVDAEPLREVMFWRHIGEPRMRRTGRFELAVVPEMDHSLLIRSGRELAADLLTAHVLRRYAGVSPGLPDPAPDSPMAHRGPAALVPGPAFGEGG